MLGLVRFVLRLLAPEPKRWWCCSCQMECFDIKVARLPEKHHVGLCVRCATWRPVVMTAA